jgi:chaperonin cofactor prefoldin
MPDSDSPSNTEVALNEKNFEVLVAKFVPTSQYFERSFQMLQNQMDDFKEDQKELKADINRRFEEVNQGQKDIRLEMDRRFEEVNQGQKDIRLEMDKRFEQVDKRFEQVDKRFEQVDRRFDQVNAKLDTIIERMDMKIDAGLRETRSLSIRLFSFAMIFSAISMAGFLAKMTGLF